MTSTVDPVAVFSERRSDAIRSASAAKDALLAARAKFDEYSVLIEQNMPGGMGDRSAEARKRLSQMLLVLEDVDHIAEVEAEANAVLAAVAGKPGWAEALDGPDIRAKFDRVDNARYELWTESFYWVGGRARSILRTMPGLNGFEGEGVRNVRNKLIEHAEAKDSAVMICSFASGGAAGPVVKAVRYQDQQSLWPDAGLYSNVLAFATELVRRLDATMAGIRAGTIVLRP